MNNQQNAQRLPNTPIPFTYMMSIRMDIANHTMAYDGIWRCQDGKPDYYQDYNGGAEDNPLLASGTMFGFYITCSSLVSTSQQIPLSIRTILLNPDQAPGASPTPLQLNGQLVSNPLEITFSVPAATQSSAVSTILINPRTSDLQSRFLLWEFVNTDHYNIASYKFRIDWNSTYIDPDIDGGPL